MPRPALALVLALTVAAFAASPSGAQDLLVTGVRPGWTTPDGTRMAALHLRLAPGWKTYWRAPGDAGIPPVFDWSGSRNLGAVRLHWPAPHVFETNGLATIGYAGELVLPVEITPVDPGQPVVLKVQMAMGLCKDVCVPAEASFEAALEGETRDPAIRAALAARPATATEAGIGRIACEVEPIGDGLRVRARIALPGATGGEMVVLEPGQPEVWVSGAEIGREGGMLVATSDMVPPEAAPFALDRSDLRVTVIDDNGAIEIAGCPAP